MLADQSLAQAESAAARVNAWSVRRDGIPLLWRGSSLVGRRYAGRSGRIGCPWFALC
ncbi:MAG TPA: hypothetical protein VGN15_04880 [Ktedonobacteraceae bacterium]|nr:hypothetical protein [Ktedonobacteraceae bacterium]